MLAYSSFLYYLVLLTLVMLSGCLVSGAKKRLVYVAVPIAFLSLKYGLILLNESLGIFDAKIAGNFTLELYDLYKELGPEVFATSKGMKTFRPQLLFNLLAFELLGKSREIMLITNAALTTMAGVIAFFGLRKLYGFTVGLIAMLLINFYPAAINFSFFGLRDPVIYFGVAWNIISIIQMYKGNFKIPFVGFIISLMIIIVSRPELAAIVFFPIIFAVYFLIKRFYFAIKSLSSKIFATWSLLIFFVIPLIGVGVAGYTFVVGQIGSVVSPIQLMEVNAEYRYARAEKGPGGMSGSHILPPNIYKALPWYGRWPIQTVGIIVLPFPWMVTSVAKVMAFLDSLFLILFIFIFLKYRKRIVPQENMIQTAIFLSFIMGLIIMGMIISNAGNAFRMRLTLAPYLLIPAAIYIGLLFRQSGFSKILSDILKPSKSINKSFKK